MTEQQNNLKNEWLHLLVTHEDDSIEQQPAGPAAASVQDQENIHNIRPNHPALTLYGELYAAYSDPSRHYHGIPHIYSMLTALEEAGQLTLINYLATWFHDAIYIPGAPDNEEKSANWASKALNTLIKSCGHPNLDQNDICVIHARILATKAHQALGNIEGDSFLDADMAILGTSNAIYTRYTENIRREFSLIPDDLFAKGRSDFIRTTLNTPRIFHTEYFHELYEIQARRNLQTELKRLA